MESSINRIGAGPADVACEVGVVADPVLTPRLAAALAQLVLAASVNAPESESSEQCQWPAVAS